MIPRTLPIKYDLSKVDRQLGNKFWSPVDVAKINEYILRAAAVKGKFHWHKHNDDEFFLIYKGEITIDTEAGSIELKEGEGVVIPKGVKHRPRAKDRAVVLLLEPARLNTKGD
jgi:mannose-6-phosphate isomerase-like protein (cupin superfamily)